MPKQEKSTIFDLTFSSHQLIIGKSFPSEDFLIKSFQTNSLELIHNEAFHQVTTSIIEERFYWLYTSYGRPLPRTDHVISIEDGEKTTNPRTKKQIEPNNQLFAVYDFITQNFYISNLQQKNFFKTFFEKYTKDEVIIKNHYKNIDEFLKEISSVEKISFTGCQNLFSNGGDLMEPLKDIFGYGEPVEFFIEAKYGAKKEKFIERIKDLWKKQQSSQLKTLVCIGKNDGGLKIFNTNSIIDKLTISSNKDEQSLFCETDVQKEILNKLRKSNV